MKQLNALSNEWEPPAACITRIVKAALPDQVQITKEAKAAFSKSAGIFILYLTTCANDHCHEKKRQTVSAVDIMQAVSDLEMEEFKVPLQTFLQGYRANEGAKRKSKQSSPKASTTTKKSKKQSQTQNEEEEDFNDQEENQAKPMQIDAEEAPAAVAPEDDEDVDDDDEDMVDDEDDFDDDD
mmetsp:Transcript_1444/g.1904  ORF Transcript_1444/g.1904 Transcript_1444/m.1904 type:complete len:182 (+) Transcript_1444:49-594(+)